MCRGQAPSHPDAGAGLGGESAEPRQRTGGETRFSSLEWVGSWGLRLEATPPRPGGSEGGQPGSPPPRTLSPSPAPPPARSRTSLEPVPYTAKRGEGQGPPHCSTETRAPFPRPGPGAGARGPFLVSGWTRSYSVPRRPPKPPPPTHSTPWSRRVWLGVPPFSVPVVCLSPALCLLSSVLLCLSLFSVPCCLFFCPPVFRPVFLSPDYLFPVHILRGGSHWKDQTLPYSFLFPSDKSPHEQNPKPNPPPYRSRGSSAAGELNFFLCLRRLC